jgi:hypothetical protein
VNFFGKPILALQDKRREALEVAERYAYVGVRGTPSEEYQSRALAELFDAGNSLRAYARESSLATNLYCRVFRYDLDFAAAAVLSLGEAARGEYGIGAGQRRRNLHAVFVALGSSGHLSPREVAAARATIKEWHEEENRDTPTSSRSADNS